MAEQNPIEPIEVWRAVVGHEANYEVSNLGRVRSARDRRRGAWPTFKGRILRLGDRRGYRAVVLFPGRKTCSVAHLVAIAFLGPPPFSHAQINHKNAIKTDNRPENLEW